MLALKSSVLVCLNVKKAELGSIFFYLKMLKSLQDTVANDLTHVQSLIQKLKVLLKSLFRNILHHVASIRRTSHMCFK